MASCRKLRGDRLEHRPALHPADTGSRRARIAPDHPVDFGPDSLLLVARLRAHCGDRRRSLDRLSRDQPRRNGHGCDHRLIKPDGRRVLGDGDANRPIPRRHPARSDARPAARRPDRKVGGLSLSSRALCSHIAAMPKSPKSPARSTRAKASKPELHPLDEHLAALLNPALIEKTPGFAEAPSRFDPAPVADEPSHPHGLTGSAATIESLTSLLE